MSLIWADFPSGSPGLYGNVPARATEGVWAGMNNISEDPDPNITGSVITLGQNTSARLVLPTAVATCGMGGRYYRATFASTSICNIAVFYAVDGTAQLSVGIDINGYIRAYRGAGGGTLIASSTGPVVTLASWKHFEVKALISATVGTLEVRAEGVPIPGLTALTGLNTMSHATDPKAYSMGVRVEGSGTSNNFYIKDIVFWDTLGTQNNNFLSTVGVYWRPVNSDVSSGWTKSSGTSDYQLLNESPPVDSGFISAPAAFPAPSKMGFAPLPVDIVSIRGLIPFIRGMKSDSGDGNIQMSLSPDAATYTLGLDRPMTTAFTDYGDIKELSPVSGVAWTPAEFATLQLRINRTL